MPRLLNIASGSRFGHLTIIREARRIEPTKRRFRVACDCGKQTFALLEKLRQGRTVSCGCRTGGKLRRRHPLYGIWHGMLRRCADRDDPHYGGKGIRVCDQWKDFENFRSWAVSRGWKPGLTIDRENTARNYEPSNCRWLSQPDNASRRQFFDGASAAMSLPG